MSTSIQLGRSANDRRIAKTARVMLRNRYFEANPVLTDDSVSLIARPGRRLLCNVGDGPIRGMYTNPGNFEDALFVVSAGDLYRIDIVKTTDHANPLTPQVTHIGQISSETSLGSVSFAGTASIGTGAAATPPYLYVADGNILWCYTEDGYASGILTITGSVTSGDLVVIGTTHYQFTSGSVDTGTPAGTSANPWLVAMGATAITALGNLYKAVGDTGVAGTDYSTALGGHPQTDAAPVVVTSAEMVVRATAIGAFGNGVVTTTTSSGLSWGGSTTSGGGSPSLLQVPTPDDTGVISLAFVKSYVIVVPVQGGINGEYNGRFYWIEPGANTIDPLNFATAERLPDPIWQVLSFNDKFWFTGEGSIEPWYPTGDTTNTTPMAPFTGMVFNRGALPGTAVQVKDAMIFADPDGGVFSVSGNIQRVSTPAIEERIRELTQAAAYQLATAIE